MGHRKKSVTFRRIHFLGPMLRTTFFFFRLRASVPLCALVALSFSVTSVSAADIYIGSGCKVGEITDRAAIVLVRLTKTPGQDANGNIPGCEGEARLHYSANESLKSPQ